MKRQLVIALALLFLLSGCTALKYPGVAYAAWKRDLRNDRSQRTYSKAVASQAGEGQLVATYTRVEEIPLGKKLFNRRRIAHTLTLFKDWTYVYKTDSTEPYARHVRVGKGRYYKHKPGVIHLTPKGTEAEVYPIEIDLKQWTNVFVEADRYLHEYEE